MLTGILVCIGSIAIVCATLLVTVAQDKRDGVNGWKK